MKPLAGYLEDLYARLKMLQTWYEDGVPNVFWISGFYFTQSFMTAASQNFARRSKMPIDEVTFDFEVLGMDAEAYPKGPADGVYIMGMFIEGCSFDPEKKVLCESTPKVSAHTTSSACTLRQHAAFHQHTHTTRST
jgi:dynein heavy chain